MKRLVLAVMLALAAPLAAYAQDGVVETRHNYVDLQRQERLDDGFYIREYIDAGNVYRGINISVLRMYKPAEKSDAGRFLIISTTNMSNLYLKKDDVDKAITGLKAMQKAHAEAQTGKTQGHLEYVFYLKDVLKFVLDRDGWLYLYSGPEYSYRHRAMDAGYLTPIIAAMETGAKIMAE